MGSISQWMILDQTSTKNTCKLPSGCEITLASRVLTRVKPIYKAIYRAYCISPHLQVVFGPILYLKEVYVLRISKKSPIEGVEPLMLRDLLVCVNCVGWHMKSDVGCYKKISPFYIPKIPIQKISFGLRETGERTFFCMESKTNLIQPVHYHHLFFLLPPKTNMTMEKPQPFESIYLLLKDGDSPTCHSLVFGGGSCSHRFPTPPAPGDTSVGLVGWVSFHGKPKPPKLPKSPKKSWVYWAGVNLTPTWRIIPVDVSS